MTAGGQSPIMSEIKYSLLGQIGEFISLFEPHCEDQTTLAELKGLLSHRKDWPKAHELFKRIRKKTLKSVAVGDKKKACQYSFEEICAKTLYNLSYSAAPFDPDSPYWIIPLALDFANALEMEPQAILRIVRSKKRSNLPEI
jgi:hypothetical protein